MQSVADADIAISTVTKGEMYAGSAKSQHPRQSRNRQDAFFVRFASLPFDDAAANEFGHFRAALEVAGTPIGPYGMQIAAIALVHQLILVTHNTREFGRLARLSVEDLEL
jgi:tRNA(fMet)-specific endonuclease VapC